MRAILKSLKKEENGAAPVIEMTLIFPLVLLIMGLLIFMGCYVLQSVILYSSAQRIAVAAAREAAMPGYEVLYDASGIGTQVDFASKADAFPDKGVVNEIMEVHKPYRYIGPWFLDSETVDSLEGNLERLVNRASFLSTSGVTCDIETKNNILNQSVIVHVTNQIPLPQFVESLGLVGAADIHVTATAVVSDPAEFIRNTDIVFDLTAYIADELGINEKIAKYKQKFKDLLGKLGIEIEWKE